MRAATEDGYCLSGTRARAPRGCFVVQYVWDARCMTADGRCASCFVHLLDPSVPTERRRHDAGAAGRRVALHASRQGRKQACLRVCCGREPVPRFSLHASSAPHATKQPHHHLRHPLPRQQQSFKGAGFVRTQACGFLAKNTTATPRAPKSHSTVRGDASASLRSR